MAGRAIIIFGVFLLLGSCQYDLDVTGVAYTPFNVNERFDFSMEWDAEHPAREITVSSDNYTILVGSDSHVGSTNNFSGFLNAAEELNAEAVFITGDASTGREEDYEILYSELSLLGDIPVCLTPGNHDLYFSGWESFSRLFGPSVYTFTVHRPEVLDLYIFLDTGGGTLGTLQLEWLQNLLEDSRLDYENVVVLTHVNFFRPRFTNSTNLLNEELLLLIDLFEKHKVNMIIQGHDHKRNVEIMGHSTYLTLDALKDGTTNPSYLELQITTDGLGYNFVDI
jgi:3',5'-cyclic AMP phosphodiesterase CpdA